MTGIVKNEAYFIIVFVMFYFLSNISEFMKNWRIHVFKTNFCTTFDDSLFQSAMTLKQLKQVQFIARANGWNDNVAATVLVTKADSEKVTEEELMKALESKYDVMRDKLLAEVSAVVSQVAI